MWCTKVPRPANGYAAVPTTCGSNVEGFQGDWRLEVIRIIGVRLHASSWIEFTNADGTIQPGLCFFDLRADGKIVRITDFWPDPYELPAGRAHLVERY